MFRHGKNLVMVILFVVVAVLMGRPVAAQTYWMWPGNENSISLEVLKPRFDRGEGFGTLNTVWFLSGRFKATDRLSIFVDLPLSNYDRKSTAFPSGDKQTQIGNPYIGIENRLTGSDSPYAIIGRLGFRPPIASDDKLGALVNGFWSTYDRLEAFIPDLWSFTGGVGYSRTLEGVVNYSASIDGVLTIPNFKGAEPRLYLNYNLGLLFPLKKVNLGTGFNGRWLVTEPHLDFGTASHHQLGLSANYEIGGLNPGLHIRFPIDEGLSRVLDYVYGMSLTYSFKS